MGCVFVVLVTAFLVVMTLVVVFFLTVTPDFMLPVKSSAPAGIGDPGGNCLTIFLTDVVPSGLVTVWHKFTAKVDLLVGKLKRHLLAFIERHGQCKCHNEPYLSEDNVDRAALR